jgi:hypothetical protein
MQCPEGFAVVFAVHHDGVVFDLDLNAGGNFLSQFPFGTFYGQGLFIHFHRYSGGNGYGIFSYTGHISFLKSVVTKCDRGLRNPRDTQSIQYPRKIFRVHVLAQTGFADALESRDYGLVVRSVFESQSQHCLGGVTYRGHTADIAFAQKNVGHGLFHLGRRDIHCGVAGGHRVADAG